MQRIALAFVLLLTACGNGTATSTSNSGARGSSPLASPSQAPTQPPAPAVAAIAVVNPSLSGAAFTVSLLAADGRVLGTAQGSGNSAFQCADQPSAAIGPAVVSTSNRRAYYLAGDSIKWIDTAGGAGSAARIAVGARTAVAFSVAPDDSRLAVNVLDYSRYPITQRLYVANVDGSGARDIYTVTDTNDRPAAAVWPTGWRGGNLLLAYSARTCSFQDGPGPPTGFGRPNSYHLVRPDDAVRVMTIASDFETTVLDVGPAGALYFAPISSEVGFERWDGTYGASRPATAPAAALSPDGVHEAVMMSDGIHVFGPNSPAEAIGNATNFLWIDNSSLFLGGTAREQPRIWRLGGSPVPVATAGAGQGRIPGTLDAGRGT
jgi:hypothetical protein